MYLNDMGMYLLKLLFLLSVVNFKNFLCSTDAAFFLRRSTLKCIIEMIELHHEKIDAFPCHKITRVSIEDSHYQHPCCFLPIYKDRKVFNLYMSRVVRKPTFCISWARRNTVVTAIFFETHFFSPMTLFFINTYLVKSMGS